ncbi:alanine dehydrogenase [Odoribacter sp. OttesenSCG-928-A06]|nr:alanine dehydrogenase [Odoribacter sp. OttesenSCG-928-A06]
MEGIPSSLRKEYLFCQEEELYLYHKNKRLVIGIPNETDRAEYRVCLTPESVRILVAMGHQIVIQRGAAIKANYTDMEYSEAGAYLVNTKEEVYTADVILKVTTVSLNDTQYMREHQIILSSLKLFDLKKEAIVEMMQKKVTALGFDILKDSDGFYPVIRIMSEIAGNAAIMVAGEYLNQSNGGKGIILGGVSGITPTEVIILGAGTLGEYAARAAMSLGATVKMFDFSLNRLMTLREKLGQTLYTSVFHEPVLSKALKTADVVIGAMRCFDTGNNVVLYEEKVRQMKRGAVIVDLAADHGGCIETVRPTTHENPVYTLHDVLHYCVPNVLSRVPRTASIGFSNVLLPLLKDISEKGGLGNALKTDAGLRSGMYIYNGILTKNVIADKFGLSSRDINLLIASF